MTDGWKLPDTPADAFFTIVELESEGDYEGVLRAPVPQIPHAVITNFSPLTDAQGVPLPAKAAPLVERGYVCISEAYLGDNPNATPENLDFRARQLGWSGSQPAFGVYNTPLSTYDAWKGWPGASDYLGEYIL